MASHDGLLRPRRKLVDAQPAASVQAQRVPPQSAVVTPAQRRARAMPRTAEMLAAVRRIDTTQSPQAQAEIRAWLQEVYEARGGGILLGLFGHCYLGGSYIDHVFDFAGEIVDHYTPSQTVPAMYLPARPYAASEAYDYIEIYSDGQIVPVRPDGTAVV